MSITFDTEVCPLQIYRVEGGVESQNLAELSEFDYFTESAGVDDCIYFAFRGYWRYPWHDLKFFVGTPLQADAIEIVWEYSVKKGWIELPDVVDGTNAFRNAGENWVTWRVPEYGVDTDWASVRLFGSNAFWVRCRIASLSNLIEGGAQSTQPVKCRTFAITVTEYPENNPCTLDDIYSADVANGWGKLVKLSACQYHCKCNLVVGDWENSGKESWLVVKKQSLCVDGLLQVIEYGNFQIGTLVDLATRRCTDGGHLHFTRKFCKGSFYSYYAAPFKGSYGTIRNRILASVITGEGYAPYVYSLFLSSIRDGAAIVPLSYLAEPDVTNRATLCADGHALDPRDGVYEDIFIHDSDRAIRLPNHAIITVRNLKVRNCNYLYRDDAFEGSYNYLHLIDADTDTWEMYFNQENVTSKVFRKYSVNIEVTDADGSPIVNAILEIFDKDGNLVCSASSDADGKFPEQIVLSHIYGWQSGSRPGTKYDIDYNPFTICITKDGYEKYEWRGRVESKIKWSLTLNSAAVNPDQEALL